MNTSYLFLAEGFEIAEAMCPADMMTRGGIPLKSVSVTEDRTVESSKGVRVIADLCWSEFLEELDAQQIDGQGVLVFPGGMPGSKNLAAKGKLMEIAQRHFDRGGVTAAICAAPSVVLGKLKGLEGRRMCCYEGFEAALEEAGADVVKSDGVVVDKNIVSSRGAGHAIAFGLAIVAAAAGKDKAARVAASVML